MASSDTDNIKTQQNVHDDAANPFISFRRFADEQMSSLLHHIIGLPSAFGSSPSDSRHSAFDDDAWLQEARKLRHHMARESEEAKKIMSICRSAAKEGNGDEDRNTEVSRCPYRPTDQEAPRYDRGHVSEVALPWFSPFLPSGVHLERSTDLYDVVGFWPIAYIARSPYSPLRLERTPPFCEQGDKWRDAFEDLVLMENKTVVPDSEPRKRFASGALWMASLLDRGLSTRVRNQEGDSPPKEENSAQITATRPSHDDAEEAELTELDLYESFLSSQHFQHHNVPAENKAPPDGPAMGNESVQPSLLSTLTSTERSTLPDGSIHTKIVLKKRFSDGREESTETVHTAYDSPHSAPKSAMSSSGEAKEPAVEKAPASREKEPQKKGWFWS